MKGKLLSYVQLLVTPWTAAYKAPPSMGFSRQEYWSGVPLLLHQLREAGEYLLLDLGPHCGRQKTDTAGALGSLTGSH